MKVRKKGSLHCAAALVGCLLCIEMKLSVIHLQFPKLIVQNRFLDFGFGFYTTTNRDQAVNFARKVTERRKTGKPTLNIYTINEKEAFQKCK